MARLLYLTDLHSEFAPFDLLPLRDGAGIDAVCLGGDTGVGMPALDLIEAFWDAYGVPVFFVLGNHEYYNQEVLAFERAIKQRLDTLHARGVPVHWLQGDAHVIAGTRIIGATLWTDMQLLGDGGEVARWRAERGMNDYRRVRIAQQGPLDTNAMGLPRSRGLTTADTIGWHHAQRRAIMEALATPFDGPTVVMTHHLPCKECISPRYQNDGLNPAFASDMAQDIANTRADWWLYGHSHGPVVFDIQRTDGKLCKMRSNCRGYPKEWAHTHFDPLYIIDTAA